MGLEPSEGEELIPHNSFGLCFRSGGEIHTVKAIWTKLDNLKNCDYSIRIGENLGIVQILGADSSKRVLDAIGIKSGIAKKEASLDHGIVEIRDISSRLII